MEELAANVKEYSKAHKCFVQLLLKRKLLLISDVGPTYQQIVKEYYDIANFQLTPAQNKELANVLMEQLNAQLRTVGMRVVQVPDESRCSTDYMTIVSDRSYSQPLSLAVGFSSDELVVFKMWIKMMYNVPTLNDDPDTSTNGAADDPNTIGELELEKAINIHCNGTRLTAAEKLIDKFVKCNWLVKDEQRSVIRLHPSAFAEISTNLLSELQLPFCELCSRGIFLRRLAFICACQCIYHVRCIKKLLTLPARCQRANCCELITDEMMEPYEFDADIIAHSQNTNHTSEIDRTFSQHTQQRTKAHRTSQVSQARGGGGHHVKQEIDEEDDEAETEAPSRRRRSSRRAKQSL